MEYKVTWVIDLDADSPEDAARKALAIHRNPDSWATHFEVRDCQGRVHEVDLEYPVEGLPSDTVHVLVPMEEGVVTGVQALRTAEAAAEAEKQWLLTANIRDEKEREHQSDYGTGIAIWKCELKG